MRGIRLLKLANIFYRLAKTVGITTFHGTNADYVPQIVEQGLRAKVPLGAPGAARAVYLTNNIETSARYCRDFSKPIILEIYLSSPRRVNKLVQDPLDMDESLYEDYDSEVFFSEDIRYLDRKINEILGYEGYTGAIDLPNEIEDFRGFNLYGAIKDYAKGNNLDLRLVKKRMVSLLPEMDLDYLRINNSGVISLLPAVYDQFHQMYYRKDIPAVAIKAVWIPKSKLLVERPGVEEKSFGRRLIPADIRPLQNIINNFRSNFFKIDYSGSSIELEDMNDIISSLDEEDVFGLLKEGNQWGPSFIDSLKILRDRFEGASEEDQVSIKHEFYSKFLDFEPLDPGEVAGKETWVRIPINNLEELSQVGSLYNS